MPTIETLLKSYTKELETIYDSAESENIVHMLFEHVLECDKASLFLQLKNELTIEQTDRFEVCMKELRSAKPIQYVLGEADFFGLKFKVNEGVLIPRPETEELVDWVLKDAMFKKALSILDIGTGSGCIPITIKKKTINAIVTAIDISEPALAVAKENAKNNNTDIEFKLLDILDRGKWDSVGKQDIIISNPPYVLEQDKNEMAKHVLDYEPHLALFVEDNDALVFYNAIADFAKEKLNEGGKLYFEINESKGEELKILLSNKGAKDIVLKEDMNGKGRMVSCMF